MLSNRPYLLRAFFQWIVDSACTPILVLNANHPRCKVPVDYIENGEIIFNISAAAVRDLKITNESIEFKASFSGVVHIISAPVKAILSIYAEENGEGIFFDAEEDRDEGDRKGDSVVSFKEKTGSAEKSLGSDQTVTEVQKKNKPILKLVE